MFNCVLIAVDVNDTDGATGVMQAAMNLIHDPEAGFLALEGGTDGAFSHIDRDVGDTIDFQVTAHDPDATAPLSYTWVTASGPITNQNLPIASYTCTAPGLVDITIMVSDGDSPCDQYRAIQLACNICGNAIREASEACDRGVGRSVDQGDLGVVACIAESLVELDRDGPRDFVPGLVAVVAVDETTDEITIPSNVVVGVDCAPQVRIG